MIAGILMMDENQRDNMKNEELLTRVGDNMSERILRKYMDPVIEQALIELARVKSVFRSSLHHLEENKIQDIGYHLKLITGGMVMLSLGRAASILHSCSQYISDVLPAGDDGSINHESAQLFLDIVDDMSCYLDGLRRDVDHQETLLCTMEDKALRLFSPAASGAVPVDVTPVNQSLQTERSFMHDEPATSMEEPEISMNTTAAQGREKVNIELKRDFLHTAGKDIRAGGMVLRMLRKSPDSVVLVKEFRKILNSLKASAFAAGLPEVVELCHSMELLVTMLIRREDQHTDEINSLLTQSYEQLTAIVEQYGHQETMIPVEELVLRINRRLVKPAGHLLKDNRIIGGDRSDRGGSGRVLRGGTRKSGMAIPGYNVPRLPTGSSGGQPGLDTHMARLNDIQLNIDEAYALLRFRLDEMREEARQLRRHLDNDKTSSTRDGEEMPGGGGDVENCSTLRGYLDEGDELDDRNSRLMDSLGQYLTRQQQVIAALSAGLSQTRVVTIASQIKEFEKVVKQICDALAKNIRFEVIGEDIRVERMVLGSLIGPLKYLVGYSIEHGIEDTVSRVGSGKPEAGSVSLEFIKENSELVIYVRDDGRSINLDKVREAAIRLGYVNAKNELSDTETRVLVFNAGFNEKSDLPELKIHGVSLADVARMIKSIGGSVVLGTARGAGNEFKVRVPCQLDICRVLMAQVNQEIYAIPTANVEDVVYLQVREINALKSGDDYQYRHKGHDYRFRNLGMVLGIAQPGRPEPDTQHPVVLILMGNKRIALQVDQIKGQREIIVNQPVPELNRVKVISGATLLSDGRLVLVLELGALLGEDVGNLQAIKQLSLD